MRRGLWLLATLPLLSAPGAGATRTTRVARDLPSGRQSTLAQAPRARIASIAYGGGAVLHANRTHLIFWQPAGSGLGFPSGYENEIETFLARVARDSHAQANVFGLTGQYRDPDGPAAYSSSYAGAVLDTDPLPSGPGCVEPPGPPTGAGPGWSACVSDDAIAGEIARVLVSDRLPSGAGDVYFLITPEGLGSCLAGGPDACALGGPTSGYCGYHAVSSTAVLYAVIPYNAVAHHCQSDNPRPNSSPADPAISTVAHELAEIVTDPYGNGWRNGSGDEIADLCINSFGPALERSSGPAAFDAVIGGGHYYIQGLWSNATAACEQAAAADVVSIAPAGMVPGDRLIFLRASARAGRARIVSYRWSFGALGDRVAHVFARAGLVAVKVRISDAWDDWAFANRVLRVVVPPPPSIRLVSSPHVGASGHAVFRFSSDAAIATFQCKLDSGAWRRCRTPLRLRALRRGRHRLSIRVRDTFGQLSGRVASDRFAVS